MKLKFSIGADACYKRWKKLGNASASELKRIIIESLETPFSGSGNPFQLHKDNESFWAKEFGHGLYFVYSVSDDTLCVEVISEPQADKIIEISDNDRHKEAVELMSRFIDDGKPKLGIFWYDYVGNILFGVEKGNAELYAGQGRLSTFPKLHKTYWQKMHHKAVARNETDSIFYNENDYTQIPRGRVFLEDGVFYVNVGDWINGYVNGVKCIDMDKLAALVKDEFNLPDDFRFRQDVHWDIGHGWSEEQF